MRSADGRRGRGQSLLRTYVSTMRYERLRRSASSLRACLRMLHSSRRPTLQFLCLRCSRGVKAWQMELGQSVALLHWFLDFTCDRLVAPEVMRLCVKPVLQSHSTALVLSCYALCRLERRQLIRKIVLGGDSEGAVPCPRTQCLHGNGLLQNIAILGSW